MGLGVSSIGAIYYGFAQNKKSNPLILNLFYQLNE